MRRSLHSSGLRFNRSWSNVFSSPRRCHPQKGSIGFPNFYFDVKVVDDYGIELAANEVGELWLKSPVVTPGYWRKPEETAKAITDGWFHTGDMVTKDDEGYFFVVDRKKICSSAEEKMSIPLR